MNDESQLRNELLALAKEAGEYLAYLSELGVESVEAGLDSDAARHVEQEVKAATSGAAHRLPALERNARAAAAEASVSSTANSSGVTHLTEAAQSSRQTEMVKRSSKQSTAPESPPPQETLFGEITPQDEASLPRSGETLEDIWADITPQCMRCPLCCQGRTQVVNSEGNPRARLMFVGEAPGADEDAQGRPFVGRAGQLLNKMIEAMGLKREDVFIGNVNRCRPPQNRTPSPAEAKTCKPFLLREIAVVQPEVIIVLGNTAMKNLLDTKEGITRLRGQFQDYNGIKVMPTFHPAYLLRDPSKKREAWEDLKKTRDYLQGKQ